MTDWSKFEFKTYIVADEMMFNLPLGVSISTMCAKCKLGCELNIDNIKKYLTLSLNDILTVKINNEDIRQNLQFEINRLEEQLKEAKGPNNNRLRLEITKEINKLKGLYITKVDLETKQPIVVNIIKPE